MTLLSQLKTFLPEKKRKEKGKKEKSFTLVSCICTVPEVLYCLWELLVQIHVLYSVMADYYNCLIANL